MTAMHRLLILASILALAAIPALGGCTSSGAGGGGACFDNDGDGYGSSGMALCTFPEFDCNDNAPNINPGADEICDGLFIDEDCDGLANELDPECGLCETFEGGEFSFTALTGTDTCLFGLIGAYLKNYINLNGIPNMDVPGYDQLGESIIIEIPGFDPIELILLAGSGGHCMESSLDLSANPIVIVTGLGTVTINGVDGTFDPTAEDEIVIELIFDSLFNQNECTITLELQGTLV